MKPLLYQFLAMAVLWIGLIFFYDEMNNLSRFIFYLVTSWVLLLLVLLVKQVIRNRRASK
ncbi:hypothetical protein [Ornithinibacillus bavariensis]|uniref:hypothetical protein n=1 Tax=Ornithinibacillus bavariensis TaxID=545502 RepID=UPI000ED9292D|nr:hypothetical protein [Ornithinibacillus sp.]